LGFDGFPLQLVVVLCETSVEILQKKVLTSQKWATMVLGSVASLALIFKHGTYFADE
jgi:hypothetical protein